MRLKELQAAVEADPKALFATCDWAMVRPVTPVTDKWYTHYDESSKASYKIWEETDPWAKCGTATRPVAKGVLVESFEYDGDGKQGRSLGQMIVRARDIGGSWGEFLSLHAEEVRQRGERFVAEQERREASQQLNERLKKIDLIWPLGEVKARDRGDRGFYSLSLSAGASTGAQETYNYDTYKKRYTEFQPKDYVLRRWNPRLSVQANTPEDVEYLFRILEEGTKAVAAKDARAAKRKAAKA